MLFHQIKYHAFPFHGRFTFGLNGWIFLICQNCIQNVGFPIYKNFTSTELCSFILHECSLRKKRKLLIYMVINILSPIKYCGIKAGIFPFRIKFPNCPTLDLQTLYFTILKRYSYGIARNSILSCKQAIIYNMV